MRKAILILILITLLSLTFFSHLIFTENPVSATVLKFDTGDTAWMIVATALVLLMTPGLGFFYGGMVGKKNVISTMLQSFMAMVIVTVLWVVIAFGLSFGPSIGGVIGNPIPNLFFQNVGVNAAWPLAPTIPFLLFALFQAKFAIITPALVTGAFAERVRFWAYLLFMVLFILFVYTPLAHCTWHPDGLFFKMGVLDFAGGTVVHMSAGWAALAGALFLGKRKIQNYLCFIRNRVALVWLVRFQCWFGDGCQWHCGASFGNNECSGSCGSDGLGFPR